MLLATKLHAPGPQPGFVPRRRLAARLDEGLERGLVLVCVPAASGKTALLSGWARCGRRSAAWLSPDAGDNDRPGSGRGQVKPAHRAGAGRLPRYSQKHVGHALAKLGAASRTEAADRAGQLGLVP